MYPDHPEVSKDQWVETSLLLKQAVNDARQLRNDAAEAEKAAKETFELAQITLTNAMGKLQDHVALTNWHAGA